ncbi:hypothetical protein ACP4OV_001437 [Aristida adscensionis]
MALEQGSARGRRRARGACGTLESRRRAAAAASGEEEVVEEEVGGGRRQRPGRGRTRRWRRDERRVGREAQRRRSSTDRRVRLGGGGGGGGGSGDSGRRPLRGRWLGSSGQMMEAILKAIEDRRRQEEKAAASAALAACPPSWLAALQIATRPNLVVPLAVLTTVAVALSQGWLKLEPVDLGEIIKDLYGRCRE